ncbi:pentapeptide repeat-containing protein [Maridesulfovibrio ferrireducens]|uniref:pentapeptide repeat-containing protein n=1 Tax=Maridesulfovibrio ferrireducens TaxID=246191 RepID=UPI001A1BE536|nr:pentapeptide repeat-containing protein [Maridesulfovibrio ferrireducens]MBI9110035.1 pentapeptide repeat-containing protein [Maridesulfovibrio ferrireducens]
MGCCIGAEHNNWCAKLSKEDSKIVYVDGNGKEYCIFHAPAEHKYVSKYVEGVGEKPALISGDKFNAKVFKRIQGVIDAGVDEERDKFQTEEAYLDRVIMNVSSDKELSVTVELSECIKETRDWNPRCNFAGTVFFDQILFHHFDDENVLPPINFSNCLFKKEVSFYNSCFSGLFFFTDTVFENNACFSCKCQKGAYFLGAIFERRADFRDIDVKGLSNFTSSQFCCEAWFYQSNFHGKTIFKESYFKGGPEFDHINFYEEVSFEDVFFEKYVLFASTHFHGEAGFESTSFKNGVDFQVTEFHGFANFKKTFFLNNSRLLSRFCKFHGGVSFNDSVFGYGPNISECEFSENVSFKPSSVNGSVEIESCKFFKDLSYICINSSKIFFKKNRVMGVATFSDSEFNELRISDSTFESQVLFKNTNFGDLLEVKDCTFEKTANFNNATFVDTTTKITDSLFNSWVYFRDVDFGGPTSFDGTICEKTILMERANVKKLSFINMNIESFKFVECKWNESHGYASIYDEEDLNKSKSYSTLEEIYRRLKKGARESTDEVQTSNWHYKEKEMNRRNVSGTESFPFLHFFIIFASILAVGHILANYGCASYPALVGIVFTIFCYVLFLWGEVSKNKDWFSKIYLNVYNSISGYGEKPEKALGVLGVFILLSMVIVAFLPDLKVVKEAQSLDFLSTWLWYLPLSKIDAQSATGLNSLFRVICNILITIQAALFAFALRNKLRR